MTNALERPVWQPRYWERMIRDDRDFADVVACGHWNPVKHGHAADPDDWPHSTWHRWKAAFGRTSRCPTPRYP